MPFPYAFIKVLSGEEPFPLDRDDRLPKEQAEFLLKNGNMKAQYLGACLDSCRWGSTMTVMYEMSIKELVGLIQNWMNQNKNIFQDIFHERKIENLYKRFKLPYINHKECPRDKEHKSTTSDLDGRIRCTHITEKRFKPNFVESYKSFDKHSQTIKREYLENKPTEPASYLEWWEDEDNAWHQNQHKAYERAMKKYEKEEESLIVRDICSAILSDKKMILPLETIIRRLNISPETHTTYCKGDMYALRGECKNIDKLDKDDKELYELSGRCPGHTEPYHQVEFRCDGWDLAFYTQKWFEQLPGNQMPPLFE